MTLFFRSLWLWICMQLPTKKNRLLAESANDFLTAVFRATGTCRTNLPMAPLRGFFKLIGDDQRSSRTWVTPCNDHFHRSTSLKMTIVMRELISIVVFEYREWRIPSHNIVRYRLEVTVSNKEIVGAVVEYASTDQWRPDEGREHAVAQIESLIESIHRNNIKNHIHPAPTVLMGGRSTQPL